MLVEVVSYEDIPERFVRASKTCVDNTYFGVIAVMLSSLKTLLLRWDGIGAAVPAFAVEGATCSSGAVEGICGVIRAALAATSEGGVGAAIDDCGVNLG
jgi:hypothetical protein